MFDLFSECRLRQVRCRLRGRAGADRPHGPGWFAASAANALGSGAHAAASLGLPSSMRAGRRPAPSGPDPPRQCRAPDDDRRAERRRGRAEHRARRAGDAAARRRRPRATKARVRVADARASRVGEKAAGPPPEPTAASRLPAARRAGARVPQPRAELARAPPAAEHRAARCRARRCRAGIAATPRATIRPRRRSRLAPKPARRRADAALASMAQRLDAALRRPAPEPRTAPQPAAATGARLQRRGTSRRPHRTPARRSPTVARSGASRNPARQPRTRKWPSLTSERPPGCQAREQSPPRRPREVRSTVSNRRWRTCWLANPRKPA